MLKAFLLCMAVVAHGASAEGDGYGNPAPAPAPASYSQYAPASQPAHDGYYGQPQGGHGYGNPGYGSPYYYGHKVSFPPARPFLDSKYYLNVMTGFQQCVDHKCLKTNAAYGETMEDSIEALGEHTACVASCAAAQMMAVVSDFRNLLAKMYDIGSAQLVNAKKYVAGKGEYEVIKERTRIYDSCCLPSDYFVAWEEIMCPVESVLVENWGDYGHASNERLISCNDLIDYCISESRKELFLDNLQITCNTRRVSYLEDLKRNVGHLILAPKCETLAPNGACTSDLARNPRAAFFENDVCVAVKMKSNGDYSTVEKPLVKEIVDGRTPEEQCPPDNSGDEFIYYRKVSSRAVNLYLVKEGLPSRYTGYPDNLDGYDWNEAPSFEDCEYNFGLSEYGPYGLTPTTPGESELEASKYCPTAGKFEYCNMEQYISWLHEQLFDVAKCPISDIGVKADSDNESEDLTLACMFRVTSLKCDCMTAVLNCYEREHKFTTAFGQTVGKAASVLCGFILCQKSSVYQLFAGQKAIDHGRIMHHILMEMGALSPSVSAIPPATLAFVFLLVGSIAFVVVKKSKKAANADGVKVEDGYRNLI